jgi:hypothetical protein
MLGPVNLIPKARLERLPKPLRLAHEYCFFLQDNGTRLLVEYEAGGAHHVPLKFRNIVEFRRFEALQSRIGSIAALREFKRHKEVRRIILNNVTMALVSDCQHHIFEALKCLEKRKFVVAMNLLRKPLTDNLLYLAWLVGDEDGFYKAFTENSPKGIKSSVIKGLRSHILPAALSKLDVADVVDSTFLETVLFSRDSALGLQRLFQHAVHLVTVERIEFETTPENFNFIFKPHADDNLYEVVYAVLPQVLLFLSHLILASFERMAPAEKDAKQAFEVNSVLGLSMVTGGHALQVARETISRSVRVHCPVCREPIKVTGQNAARMVLRQSYRCTGCRRIHPCDFPPKGRRLFWS